MTPQNEKSLEMSKKKCNVANPVAISKVVSVGKRNGKAIKSHFRGASPECALLCVGSKVALENKNFCPEWGLHNGAVGTVQEVVFAPGHNPNNGDLPLYVIVEFLQYCGPVWDQNIKKVCVN